MKKMILAVVCLAFPALLRAQLEPNFKAYPEFTWDKVPVCIHLANSHDDFTPAQIKYMAQFPLICIEKNQAYRKHKNMIEGTCIAAKALKKANPKTKALFYWNSRIDYGEFYPFGRLLNDDARPEWAMKDVKGEYVVVHSNNRRTFDPSNADFRQWWVQTAVEAIDKGPLDGVFIDALPQFAGNADGKRRTWGEKKYDEVMAGLYSMLTELKEGLGPDRILIGNSLRGEPAIMPDMGTRFFDYLDGGMLEHFAALSGNKTDHIVRDIELLQEAGRRGKIIVFKGWPRYNFTESSEYKNKPAAEMEAEVREDIVFPLACFLVGAGKYAYFCYSWGYQINDGGLIDYDEYKKPLGEPLGDAVKEGYTFRREFKHASVWVDVENRNARIDWK